MAGAQDFVVEVTGVPDRYVVHVRSRAGECSADLGMDVASVIDGLDSIQAAVLASAAGVRDLKPVAGSSGRSLEKIGGRLFDALFGGDVGALLLASRNDSETRDRLLRIVLLLPSELARLPWECLFDTKRGTFICSRTPVVRYVAIPEPIRPVTVNPPLRVLGMIAQPDDLPELDVENERRQLSMTLAPLEDAGLATLRWVNGQTWSDLQAALLGGCHVFHFIGHGTFDKTVGESVIALTDARGRADLIRAPALLDLLMAAGPAPRVAVLNCCATAKGHASDMFSSVGAALARRIPAVVAMQFAITDDAAQAFAAAFYMALTHNQGVDEAVRAGRLAIMGQRAGTLEWITPVLYLRTTQTRLFKLPASAQAERRPSHAVLHQTVPTASRATCVDVSADNTRLCVVGVDGSVRIHDLAAGTRTTLHGAIAQSAQFGPDGRHLVTADRDGHARIWDTTNGRQLHDLHHADTPNYWAHYSPDGAHLATTGLDGHARIWNTTNGRQLHDLHHADTPIYWAHYSPDGAHLATTGLDGHARIWDTTTGDQLHDLWGAPALLIALFAPTGHVVTFCEDGTIRCRTADAGSELFATARYAPGPIALSRDGRHMAVYDVEGAVRICDLSSGAEIMSVPGGDPQGDLAFCPDGRLVITTSQRKVQIWDLIRSGAAR
ncbi:CHAT domain-containing protein [Streptosporangiaceae bacterium NEAU-GS5]|nr:CHAT domain-containing protein [Streptosporangiaceae bacterium NEAU-GS5]